MTNPYASPTTEQLPPSDETPGEYGGLNRAIYFWVFVGLAVFQVVMENRLPGISRLFVFAILLVATGYRCSNVGMNPKWCLALLLPLLNLFVLGRCLVCQTGYMKHKRLDLTGKIGFGFFLAFVAISLTGLFFTV